jgi:DNA-binding transcriptional regulator YhcF (GntR family)
VPAIRVLAEELKVARKTVETAMPFSPEKDIWSARARAARG